MRILKILPIVILGLASSLAVADEKNCSDLKNPQARQECLQHQYGGDADCTKLANPQARKECLEHKQSSGNVDCSKLATEEARRQCMKQKAK